MARSQSPGYPNISLDQALMKAKNIFDADRTNIIDREVAARHIGYSGLSGASDKALSTLSHYDLLEKAGKGQAKLTDLSMRIFAPVDVAEEKAALLEAGSAPSIFGRINAHFDSEPSEDALRNWLIREEFRDSAIKHVIKAYTGTMAYLKQEKASESPSPSVPDDANQAPDHKLGDDDMSDGQVDKRPQREHDWFEYVDPKPKSDHSSDNDFTIVVDDLRLQIQCRNVNAAGLARLIEELKMYQGILTIREKASHGGVTINILSSDQDESEY